MRSAIASVSLTLLACGTVGDAGGGSANLPVSGAGPFKSLSAGPGTEQITPPYVLSDLGANLDHPFVIADGQRLAIWVTANRQGQMRIEHADSEQLMRGFGDLELSLAASEPWEQSGVYGPAVIQVDGSHWILVYGAGGAIGWAISSDGHNWEKAPGPAILADGSDEGTQLGAPGAVRFGDRVRVYYEANGRVWGADAALADVVEGRATQWSRLDGDPSTPTRDPILAPTAFARGFSRVTARLITTSTGRTRHDLYFTTYAFDESDKVFRATLGYASSFTGDHFRAGAGSLLPLHMDESWSPTGVPYGAGSLLLYIDDTLARDAVAAALSP